MTRIITIISGKGGVGKTSVATNLAAAIQGFGKDVILIDGNITTPNVSLHLGLAGAKQTLHDVLRGTADIKDVIYLHPPTRMKVVPAGLGLKDLKSSINTSKIEESVNALIGSTDYIIIDASAGLGKEAKCAIEAGDEVIVVTNPELPAVTDALKAVEIARRAGKNPIGVVINKVTGKSFELKPENVANFLDLSILGVVPEDNALRQSLNLYTPVVASFPESNVAVELKKIAAKIAGVEYNPPKKKGFLWNLFKLFK